MRHHLNTGSVGYKVFKEHQKAEGKLPLVQGHSSPGKYNQARGLTIAE